MKTALKKTKPNYKNWMPKGMILGTLGGALASLLLFLVFGVSGLLAAGTLKTVLMKRLSSLTPPTACL